MGVDKSPNLSSSLLSIVDKKLGFSPSPEDIFYYIYSILYSPTYRTRYAAFLKVDFPKIPFTSSCDLFNQLVHYGKELSDIHLMKLRDNGDSATRFEACGDRGIAPGYPKYEKGKVTINKQGDSFTGVPEEVWNFCVGGYQVCHKWLKDRKGCILSNDDILHYQNIVVALQETLVLMQKIDKAIPSWPIE